MGSRVWIILALLLAIAPAIAIGSMILQYGVNVPFWDQWEVAKLLINQAEGNLSIQELLAQHNEHRIFFPRLIFLALASLSQWNVVYEMLFILFLTGIASLSIYLIFRLTVTQRFISSLLFVFIANVLIFSPVQYECWLWGFQITFFLPITCFVLALVTTQLEINFWLKLLFCIILSTVSTFSLANGAICWLLLPLVFLAVRQDFRKKTLVLVALPIWLFCFFLNIGIYISGYQKPAAHPKIFDIFEHPNIAADYFLCFLGAPFAAGNLVTARLIGFLLISLYALVFLYIVFFYQKKLVEQSSAWLALGGYPILSAVMATFSRAGFGVEQALSSRYMTVTTYLAIALIGLLWVAAKDIKTNKKVHDLLDAVRISQQTSRDIAQIALTCLITICLVLNFVSSVNAYPFFQQTQRDRLYAKTCLTFVRFVSDDCITTSLFPVASQLRERAALADKFGFFQPRIAQRRRIVQSDPGQFPLPGNFGYFDSLALTGDRYTASGWAILPNDKRPADAVLLTFRRDDRSLLFAIAPVKNKRQDVASVWRDNRFTTSGWTVTFPIAQLPRRSEPLVIEAWAFNAEKGKAFRMETSHTASSTPTPTVTN